MNRSRVTKYPWLVTVLLSLLLVAGCTQPAPQNKGHEQNPETIDSQGYSAVEVLQVWEGDPLQDPAGLALQKDGTLVVADGVNHQLLTFSGEGEFLSTLGEQGSGQGQFVHPGYLAQDTQGNLYVADRGNNRIQVVNAKGEYRFHLGSREDFAPYFSLIDGYDIPLTGVAVDGEGNIYAALSGAYYDISENALRKYNPQGELLWEITSMLEGDVDVLPFTRPGAVTVDGSGTIYLTHGANGHGKVLVMATEGEAPQPQRAFQFGALGKEKGELMHTPAGIAVDGQGNIFVADTHNNRIQVFTPQGEWLLMFNLRGTIHGQLTEPGALTLDGQGNLYVADRGNGRVLKIKDPLASIQG